MFNYVRVYTHTHTHTVCCHTIWLNKLSMGKLNEISHYCIENVQLRRQNINIVRTQEFYLWGFDHRNNTKQSQVMYAM